MIDNLRDSVSSGPMFQDEGPTPPEDSGKPKRNFNLLGLTPVQRFVLALMLFLLTCVLGSLCQIVTQKVILPF
jgi:hypothetical protein